MDERFALAPTLEHSRVRLEQLAPAHAAALGEASSAGELWRTWYTSIPGSEQMSAEIDRRLGLQAQGRMAPWAVIEPASGRAVGMTTFMNIDAANRRVEIGSTWIATSVQRSGLNRAAKLLLLGRAFEELDCIAVEFRTHVANEQSRTAIAALGATQDGILRSHQILADGSLRDTVVFSITAAEWPGIKHRLIGQVGT